MISHSIRGNHPRIGLEWTLWDTWHHSTQPLESEGTGGTLYPWGIMVQANSQSSKLPAEACWRSFLEDAEKGTASIYHWKISALTGVADSRVCGFGTTGCLGTTALFIVWRVCTNLYAFHWVSLLEGEEPYRGSSTDLVCVMDLIPASAQGVQRYWRILGGVRPYFDETGCLIFPLSRPEGAQSA